MSEQSLNSLKSYVEREQFKGYDPYDTLLSSLPFHWLGKWGPVIAIQVQKRNPVNIRRLIGIPKEYNPKAMGLFLHSYSLLYKSTGDRAHLDQADFFFRWLRDNQSKGYSGSCWGYNFPWANPQKYLKPYIPSAVVTGFICRGLWAYYQASGNEEVIPLLKGAARFIMNDLERVSDKHGQSISYTPVKKDICYNASLLAGEVIARANYFIKDPEMDKLAHELVEFVIARQKEDGRWNYSESLDFTKQKSQIDFHQGYVLESIYEIGTLTGDFPVSWHEAIRKGLVFYRKEQFREDGSSLWRLPKAYPVEIHNQSQGIITFSRLSHYDPDLGSFAKRIAEWTGKNMQACDGHFYYHKYRFYSHRIPYMRWSQAWMFLALVTLLHDPK